MQNSPQYAVTDGVTAGTTTITSASAAFGTDVVGNLAYAAGGTGSVVGNWYQIVSRTNATTIVVDRSTGLTTGTGVTLNIGGALATPGNAAAIATVGGMIIWVKYSATPYNLTTATPGAGGPVVLANVAPLFMRGYDVTRGDNTGNRPSVNWGSVAAPGSNTFLITLSNSNVQQVLVNMLADGNSVAKVEGIFATNTRVAVVDCVAQNCTGTGCIGINPEVAIGCYATNCTVGFSGNNFRRCAANGCTTGFFGGGVTVAADCLAYGGCGTGFSFAADSQHWNCTADSCTTAGFSLTFSSLCDSCLASNCTGGSAVGFLSASSNSALYNCAVYNNLTNITTGGNAPDLQVNTTILTAQPYVAAGSQFAPNSTAGGGAVLRGAGTPVYGQTDHRDIGAVQHADPSGGASIPAPPIRSNTYSYVG